MSDHDSYFIDANVPMYAAGGPHPYRDPCAHIILAAARGEMHVVTDAEVIQEITYRFISIGQRLLGLEIAKDLMDSVGAVLPVTRLDVVRALELLRAYDFLPSRDAVHVAVMEAAGIRRIVTADRHFDRVPGLQRVDPPELAL